MKEKIEQLLAEVEAYVADSAEALDEYKRKYTNKKAVINDLFDEFRAFAW